MLFPVIEDALKDSHASISTDSDNTYLTSIRSIKARFSECCLYSDVAMDPYSSDGHDGLVKGGKILNDTTLPILVRMAQAQAQAGVDVVAPSDMMDGRILAIRKGLDNIGYTHIPILAYSAKYASALYGPFRNALGSAPKQGDKKTYQMDPANSNEAMEEAKLDYKEGADMLMVKPALPYLDVIWRMHAQFNIPICAYQVSGEYAMIKAAAHGKQVNEQHIIKETLTSIKRAGAKAIITYFAIFLLANNLRPIFSKWCFAPSSKSTASATTASARV